ncbi:hypothetical protein TNCV_3951961 [Trichonephila clavipes]|nr:hypothetical protein TNCV_3951961 [Trichonephila clavipes]
MGIGLKSRHPETRARRKGLSSDRVVNILSEISENEFNVGKLSCSNLDSDEDIRMSESDCEEYEESANIIDNIPENHDIYIPKDFKKMDTA